MPAGSISGPGITEADPRINAEQTVMVSSATLYSKMAANSFLK